VHGTELFVADYGRRESFVEGGGVESVRQPGRAMAPMSAQAKPPAPWRHRSVLRNVTYNSRMRVLNLTAVVILCATLGAAQGSNPRYGKWKLKSDAAAPASNIMTYEPAGANGMKITIDAVNRDGAKSQWFYTTQFDGKDQPVTGNPSTDTGSVTIVNSKINEIIYKKNGKVSQVLTNVLSPDNNTIAVIYMRMDEAGKVSNVTFATYERIR
jgi:hypothetical protein